MLRIKIRLYPSALLKGIFILLVITIPIVSFSQTAKSFEEVTYKYVLDNIKSKILNDSREIKIYLPTDYNPSEKYPVIYTLDGKILFEIAAEQAKQLGKFEVIPKCIVIGLFHKDRNKDLGVLFNTGNYTDSGKQFRDFLFNELVPYINSTYSVSGFNSIVGHSNSATFVHNLLLEEKSPFSGFVGLSQSLWGNQLEKFVQLLKANDRKKVYYFVGSGKKDSTDRQLSGQTIDSVFNQNNNPKFSNLYVLYNADHKGIAVEGIGPAMAFIFSDYNHLNSSDKNLIDFLVKEKVNPVQYLNNHILAVKETYGVVLKPNGNDIDFLFGLLRTEEQVEEVKNFELKNFEFDSDEFYSKYAQAFEYAGKFDKALEYWKLNLEKGYKGNLFYYIRPIDLLHKKMKKPHEAIAFAEASIKNYPSGILTFNYYIATISAENNIETNKGLKAINYCISNFKETSTFTLDEAKTLREKLAKLVK